MSEEIKSESEKISEVKRDAGRPRWIWKVQPPIDYIDATLTINVWETVSTDVSEGEPAKLFYVYVEQTNNGATAEDIELEITINGTAYTFTATLNSGTPYYVSFYGTLTGADFTEAPLSATVQTPFPMGGLVVTEEPFTAAEVGLVRVRQTSVVDVVSASIEVNMSWNKLEAA